MATTLISACECINGGQFRPTPLNSRFDAQLLSPNLAISEEEFLLPYLCRAFYEDLIAQKTTDDANYNPSVGPIVPKFGTNPDYETLWFEYLQEYDARAVFFNSLDDIGVQTGSNGLYTNNSEYSENVGIKGLKYKQDQALRKVKLARIRMLRYLCENAALYPLWPKDRFCKDCGCSCDDDCDCSTSKPKEDLIKKKLGIIIY